MVTISNFVIFPFSGGNVQPKLWRRIEHDDETKQVSSDSSEMDPTKTDPSIVVDPCCMILSNLTIDPENCEAVWRGFVQVT